MLSNCGAREDFWESLGQQGDQTSQSQEINPEYSLEGLMLKLKLQHFGHLIQRAESLEKTLMLGKIEGRRRRGWQDEMVGWHHQLNGHELEQTLRHSEGQGGLASCSLWGRKESDMTEGLNNNCWRRWWRISLQCGRPGSIPWVGKINLLEKGMATHSSTFAWRILWTGEPVSPWSYKESDTTNTFTFS